MSITNLYEMNDLESGKSVAFMASIAEQDPHPIIGLSPSMDVIYANLKGRDLVRYWNKTHPQLPYKLLRAIKKAFTSGEAIHLELLVKTQTYIFTVKWVSNFQQINIYGTDITQLKLNQQNIIQLAHYDTLTQIPNRKYFEEMLSKSLKTNHAKKQQLGLLLIDLDNFKIINDSLGHPMGDRLLKAVVKRMQGCLRIEDFLARIGGDEFIIIISDTSVSGASVVAGNINQALCKPFVFSGYHMAISCSIGIAISPESGTTSTELLKNADIAMYQAKKNGKNKFFLFANRLYRDQYQRDLIIKKDLKYAVSKNEFFIEYQPQFNLQTGTIFGFEALLRWDHPDKGIIYPNEFLPLAEQSGLIHSIGQWITEQAITDYKNELLPHTKGNLSINISLPQLTDARFIDTLLDSLTQYRLDKANIILDLSEHVLKTHHSELFSTLNHLKELDIKLSLDNFGSPNTPFTSFLEMPLKYIKFDQRLLHYINKRPKQQVLLKGLIGIAHNLGMEVIQKGVERKEETLLLKSFACHYAQGLFYCKPLRLADLHKFLSN